MKKQLFPLILYPLRSIFRDLWRSNFLSYLPSQLQVIAGLLPKLNRQIRRKRASQKLEKWIVTGILITMSFAYAEGNISAGKTKAIICASCHGETGNSTVSTWPKLAGQHAKYLYRQLSDLKKGEQSGRYEPTMAPFIANLSSQDMEDLAAFFAAQETTPGAAKKSLVALGQQIYRGGNMTRKVPACIACHSPQGLGNRAAGFPRLSGQHPEYVKKQLLDYRENRRTNGLNNIMQYIAKNMTKEEIEAVSSYVSGLH